MIKFKTYLEFFITQNKQMLQKISSWIPFHFLLKTFLFINIKKEWCRYVFKKSNPIIRKSTSQRAVCRLFDTFILITAGTAVTVHVPLARPPTSFYLTAWYAHSLFSTRTRLKVVKWFMRNIKKFSKWSRNHGRY